MENTAKIDSAAIMEELISIKSANSPKILSLCQTLYQYAKETKDTYAEAFSLLYFSIAYLNLSQLKPCIDYGQRGHIIQASCEYIDLLQEQDNILGCAFTYRGDFQSGMTYFYEGIHYANSKNNYYLFGLLLENTATLYRLTGAYDHALAYAKHSHTVVLKAKGNHYNIDLDNMQYQLDLLQIYFAKSDKKHITPLLAKCHESLKNPDVYATYAYRFYTLEAQIRYHEKEDFLSIFPTIKQALSSIETMSSMNYISVFWSYRDAISLICQYLAHETNCKECNSLYDKIAAYCIVQLDKFYEIALYLSQSYLWIQYDELKIQIFELLCKNEPSASVFRKTCEMQLLAAYQHYYEQCLLRDEEEKKEQLARLEDMLTLHEAQNENNINRMRAVRLKLESEQDALTGCANRFGLESFMQTYFNYTRESQKTFSCMIIDIDFFKEYNDTYGHLAGDHCIQAVCRSIRTSQNDEGFLVRYGGDEFLLLHIGKTDEELLTIAANIKKSIEDNPIEHTSSPVADHVTVTMGLVNRIPDAYSHANDFLHAADNALYEIKKTSKNHYLLVHDL